MTDISPKTAASLVTIQLRAELADAVELMQQHDIRHLPVYDGERLVGIVSERDLGVIASLVPDESDQITVAEAMTPDPYVVTADTPISAVARAMADHKYGCAVVTDGHGQLLGLFTTTDALRLLADGDARGPVGGVLTERRD